jgi:uncharacterized protein DUF2852
MPIAVKLDALPSPVWIGLVILGFVIWWPLGLTILAYALGRGRMCFGSGFSHWNDRADRLRPAPDWWRQPPTSGNRAFDDYRAETLRRLEDEQRGFHEFLGRLRMAKDKAEFDQFMAERRTRRDPAPSQPPA